ncbi:nuclear transport factor 2 family protein [Saccharothrix variisporea]|uniref:SnoaL-like protein n=1 Tax=Saccharothrix variisporea TaxID=543527 RepID=A0A495XC32_9PSEU|nr:nuclear transport factor 2 family protein [Saccharothrix variisporea]RKT69088.1 SnoaL-like protein [Saccharothrix variisporea]
MDRFDVIDTCTALVWHTDHREWDQLVWVFADRVTLDYTSLNGGEPVTLAPAQIIDGWQEALGAYTATQHLLANQLVTVVGDTAVCTASVQATHLKPDGNRWTLGGSYRFDLVRTGDGWRIGGIVLTVAWQEGER